LQLPLVDFQFPAATELKDAYHVHVA
jgi:hypothetical protein